MTDLTSRFTMLAKGLTLGGLIALSAMVMVPNPAIAGGDPVPNCEGSGNKDACDCMTGEEEYCRECTSVSGDCVFNDCHDDNGQLTCHWTWGFDCDEVAEPGWVDECVLN